MVVPVLSVKKISAIVSVAGFIMGMDISSLAIFLDKDYFKNCFKAPSSVEQGILVGATPLGGLIGCLLYCILVQRLGRVSLFRVGAVIWIKGSMCNAIAINLWMISLARWIKGLTVGLFSILISAYIGEIVPQKKKGQSMALIQVSFSLAILSAYYMCTGLNVLQSQLSFRLAWALEIIPALGLLFSTAWLPESPVWLTLNGEYIRAEEMQNNLAIEYNKGRRKDALKMMNKLELVLAYQESSEIFSFKDLFGGSCWRQTLMGSTLQLLVQLSGINILMYYITFLCDMIGLEGTVKVVSASIPYLIHSLLSLLPVTFLDHVRRKDITLVGGFPLGLIMITIGILMAINGHWVEPINGNKSLVWAIDRNGGPAILALCFLFVAIFSATLSCAPWLYTTEILPLRARTKGLPFCMSIGWTTNFLLTLLAPLMMASLKWGMFILLGCCTLAISSTILVLFPDTKNLSQEQIDLLYVTEKKEEKAHGDITNEAPCAVPEDLERHGSDPKSAPIEYE